MSGQGQGRGRGESSQVRQLEEKEASRYQGVQRAGQLPVVDVEQSSSSSDGNSDSDKTIRGRGGFRQVELHTIPPNVTVVRSPPDASGKSINILSNFIRIAPIKESRIYQYRVDFEPVIESVSLRRRLFNIATEGIFSQRVIFDGMSDARSAHKTEQKETIFKATNPIDKDSEVTIKVKLVGEVKWGSYEMMRVYNMHMKAFLRALGFFQVSQAGAYVHPDLATAIGTDIVTVRGYRTSANIHEKGEILMNLESVHKLMQRKNVLQNMMDIRQSGGSIRENVRNQLTGKLIVTNYNKVIYRVEDVNFDLNPASTFLDRKANRQITYSEYYQTRYNLRVTDQNQPLLLVVQNNKRQAQREGDENHDIYLVPEFCNIAGLTDQQRNNNRLKIDLVKSSQIPPAERASQLDIFLNKLHGSNDIKQMLDKWGYSYGREAVKIKARILPLEAIGVGRLSNEAPDKWPKVNFDAGFDQAIMRENVAKVPPLPSMAVIISRPDAQNEGHIMTKLKQGFERVGLRPANVAVHRLREGDTANHYVQQIRNLPIDVTAAIVILPNQNKEKYDAVKKLASVERGLVTQVVTSRLMMDERKANSAAVKIGIQVAAKLGGEPWYIALPLGGAMICGYDTYHDTAQRGRSFGAFLASMNNKFSRWFSRADSHDHMDELSSHMAENLAAALRRYRELNNKWPDRVFIYRDGVGDSQIEHVFKVELKQMKKACSECDERIRLCIIVVNKRIGARFYMENNKSYINPPPGSVIDDVVTRQERYDFYLVSQSTRNGTVAPTYYNIIHDESGLDAAKHQAMAYKMCFLYYNWTGTVRVPAPCQYAHKLALLCGEHLHDIPNATLDDRLHFL